MLPKVLKNFNLFIDGRGYAGRVEEITLPKLINRTEEFRLGGLDAPVQVDMGMEKLECNFILNEYDNDVIKLFGIEDDAMTAISNRGLSTSVGRDASINAASNGQIPLTMRGGLSDEVNNKVVPVAVYVIGNITELDFGQWKTGESTRLSIRLALRYYRLEVDQENLIEIEVDNRIRKVGGYDQISRTRAGFSERVIRQALL